MQKTDTNKLIMTKSTMSKSKGLEMILSIPSKQKRTLLAVLLGSFMMPINYYAVAQPISANSQISVLEPAQVDAKAMPVPSWSDLLSSYTEKLGNQQVEQALQQAVESQQDYAKSWRASDVEVVVHHETDMLNDDVPMRNWQIGAATSIMLPSQREARQNLAEAMSNQSVSEQRYLNWLASAKLRELVWQLKQAQETLKLESTALKINQMLLQKVAKQVALGESSKLDELVARQNLLAAEMAFKTAELELANRLQAYQTWTGYTKLPAAIEEIKVIGLSSSHPEIIKLEQAKAFNQAQISQLKSDKAGNPSVFLGLQQDTLASEIEDSMIFEVSIPLGLDPANNKEQALQRVELAKNTIAIEQATQHLTLTLKQIESELKSLEASLVLAQQKWEMSEQTYALSEQAYQLGEINIQTLLQIQQQNLLSRQLLADAKLDLGRTIAEYNQQAGYLVGEKQ